MADLTKLRSIHQPKGFGDDLGLDDFDLSLPSPSRLTNQNNSTRGFGDDLGLDDFSPNKIPSTPTKPTQNPASFGDDLGLDDFDPNRLPGMRKTNLQSRKSIYGASGNLGLGGYNPGDMPINKLVKKQNEIS